MRHFTGSCYVCVVLFENNVEVKTPRNISFRSSYGHEAWCCAFREECGAEGRTDRRLEEPDFKYSSDQTKKSRPGSVVGIATDYGLDGPVIVSRWGARFSAPVQTGPGAHPASCTMGTGSFPGAKSGRGVTLTPYPLPVPWSRKGRAIPLFPFGSYGLYRASVPVQG